MTLFLAISGLVNALAATVFGLVSFLKERRNLVSQTFGFLNLAIALWSFSYWLWFSSTTKESALFFARLLAWFATFIPIFYTHWVLALLRVDKTKANRVVIKAGYVATLALAAVGLTKYYVLGIGQVSFFEFFPQGGLAYLAYIFLLFVGLSGYGLFSLLANLHLAKDAMEKKRLQYIIVGTILGFGGGITNFPAWFGFNFPPVGNILVAIYTFALGYAMFKYNLMNVRLLAVEGFVAMLLIVSGFEILLAKSPDILAISVIGLVLIMVLSLILVRSVIKEIRDKERIQSLAEELEKANVGLKALDRAKSEFISIVSHQLRTPLTAVKGYISLLREGSYGRMDEGQKGILEKVYQSSERLIGLVNDLLNLSRIEEGRMTYSFKEVDWAEMIDDVVAELKTLADLKQLKFSWIKPHGLPMVWADQEKLRQVVINVIDNAIKYTDKGQINVSLHIDSKPELGALILKVRDSGVGMTKEEIDNLFKKFIRGEGGRMVYTEGTGLGLYVANFIVEAHHGTIEGRSESKGKGSTFTITIPTKEHVLKEKASVVRAQAYTDFVKKI